MKAYIISDLKGYADYSTVVFAETRGKAKEIAITIVQFYPDLKDKILKICRGGEVGK